MAVKQPIRPLTSWSFSRYSDYQRCPLAFKLKHLEKLSEPPNAAMARGVQIHELAEAYLKGRLARLPKELAAFKGEFQALRKQRKLALGGVTVEDTWAFTQSWERTRWDDWVGCWVRIKLDCAHVIGGASGDVLVVTDWKTGKFNESKNVEYLEQLELYALAALLLHPHLREVRPRLCYTDAGITYPPTAAPLVYTQADAPRLKKLWEKRVKPMFADKRYAPTPNWSCRFCFYGQAGVERGGPGRCQY